VAASASEWPNAHSLALAATIDHEVQKQGRWV